MDATSWYGQPKSKEEQLLQGELVYSCPVIFASENYDSDPTSSKVGETDVIVLTQSCDLDLKRPPATVIVCAFWDVREFCDKNPKAREPSHINQIRLGRMPPLCLLRECTLVSPNTEYLIVDFRYVYSVPYKILSKKAREGNRIQLLSPFREYLAHAFGSFFMRVGIPPEAEINSIDEKEWSAKVTIWANERGWDKNKA
jgi:hypothetical protein